MDAAASQPDGRRFASLLQLRTAPNIAEVHQWIDEDAQEAGPETREIR